MKTSIDRRQLSKILQWSLLVIVICFSLLRFVNLNADFPPGVTGSGELYTDEGWYTNGAVRYILTGQWYLHGDVNFTAIFMPVGQLLHLISFSILGPSLSSARVTIIVCFLAILALEALIIRRRFGNFAALFCALLLATNFIAFAYSRLALTYLQSSFFVIASMFIALSGWKARYPRYILASVLMAAAILANTTAVVAIPLLIYLCWRESTGVKSRIYLAFISGMTLLIIVGAYEVAMARLFPSDFAFYSYATTGRLFTSFGTWGNNLIHILIPRLQSLGKGFFEVTTVLTIIALIISKRFRDDPVVHILIGYAAFHIGMLSMNSYSPPRYYITLLLPFAGLCAIACTIISDWLTESNLQLVSAVPVSLVLLISLSTSIQVFGYITKPVYSFYIMTHEVGQIIQAREGVVRGVMLFGEIPDSISLEIGTNAANSGLNTSNTIIVRMERTHPKYLITHTSNLDQVAEALGANVTQLGVWDVFGNYYAKGEPIRLFGVDWSNVAQ